MAYDANTARGAESWTFIIYIALGFALAIEGTIIQMITPWVFPWNLVVYLVFGAATFWVFICNGWFQERLIRLKIKYESKAR
jgi:hypothetical protein